MPAIPATQEAGQGGDWQGSYQAGRQAPLVTSIARVPRAPGVPAAQPPPPRDGGGGGGGGDDAYGRRFRKDGHLAGCCCSLLLSFRRSSSSSLGPFVVCALRY
ncbi:hypothetical protein PLESTB_001318300 [Pleodorina starrii]|uniref:Uncharacterized protein n=1 Tax=Pleodorina starrii TaxID=330485 RepID=A0A9W6BUH9_9CHLO|nr:hypothetical protein PLESTM_001764200 [Pleodorina starrii]GLC58100.1 hypothetical protein PLESTB_001318300 [Pleodorina starrii]